MLISFLLTSFHFCFEGFYQLAGGTNSFTVESLKKEGLFCTRAGTGDALIGGIAYGGYARKVFILYYLNLYILVTTIILAAVWNKNQRTHENGKQFFERR
jgi:Iron-Sulfur binding protein C terminal